MLSIQIKIFPLNSYTWKILAFVYQTIVCCILLAFCLLHSKNVAYDITSLFQEQLRDFGVFTAKVNNNKISLLVFHFKIQGLSRNSTSEIVIHVHGMEYH